MVGRLGARGADHPGKFFKLADNDYQLGGDLAQ
jgi:hypothetical protein